MSSRLHNSRRETFNTFKTNYRLILNELKFVKETLNRNFEELIKLIDSIVQFQQSGKFTDLEIKQIFNFNPSTHLFDVIIFKNYMYQLELLEKHNKDLIALYNDDKIERTRRTIESIYSILRSKISTNPEYIPFYEEILKFRDKIEQFTRCTSNANNFIFTPIKYIKYFMSNNVLTDINLLKGLKSMGDIITPDHYQDPITKQFIVRNVSEISYDKLHINNWILLNNKLCPHNIIEPITLKNNNLSNILPIFEQIFINIHNYLIYNIVYVSDIYDPKSLCFTPEKFEDILLSYQDLIKRLKAFIENDKIDDPLFKEQLLKIITTILTVFDKKSKIKPRTGEQYLQTFLDDDELNKAEASTDSTESTVSSAEESTESSYKVEPIIPQLGGISLNNNYKNYLKIYNF